MNRRRHACPQTIDGMARITCGFAPIPAAPSATSTAVLPLRWSVQVNATVRAFATIVDGGGSTATKCRVSPTTPWRDPHSVLHTGVLQSADPRSDALIGLRTPVHLGQGVAPSIRFARARLAAFDLTDATSIVVDAEFGSSLSVRQTDVEGSSQRTRAATAAMDGATGTSRTFIGFVTARGIRGHMRFLRSGIPHETTSAAMRAHEALVVCERCGDRDSRRSARHQGVEGRGQTTVGQ